MKIAAVELAGRGGMIHYAYQLATALAGAGAEVTLVTDRHYELVHLEHRFRLARRLRLWDPKPAAPPPPSRVRRAARGVLYYREWLRLVAVLGRLRPDWVLLGDQRFAGDLAPLLLLRLAGLRLAAVCHNLEPLAGGKRGGGRFRRDALTRRLYGASYRGLRQVFVHYESNRRRLLDLHGLDPRRVTAIPHGNAGLFLELRDPGADAAAVRRRLGLAPDTPLVLFFGTLTRYKGIDVLLTAFAAVRASLPAARVVVAGFPAPDFDLEQARAQAASQRVADAVLWEPRYLDAAEVAAWLEAADVVAFPYRAIWQSGAVVVAQTLGRPLVATRVGALPEMVRDGETGLLVEPGDPADLARALLRLLGDRGLAARLGRAAAAYAREALAWPRVAEIVLGRLREDDRGSA